MTTRTICALLAALALAAGSAGCGGAGDEDPGGGAEGRLAPVPGFDGRTISVGALTPLSGPVAVIGLPLTAGNEVYFDAVNARGGVAGRYKVELLQEDTQYEPDRTVQKYNKLKGDVVAFAQVFGTAPTLAVLPQLRRDRMIASPASLDAPWVREENLLPVGGPYQLQAINALDYYVQHGGGRGKAICSFIQDDAYGEAGQQGVEFAAGKLSLDLRSTQRFKAGDKDVTGQVQNLRRAGCDAVMLVATPTDAGTIWATAAKLGFAPRWIGQSPVWSDELARSSLRAYLERTTWIVSEGTEWGDRSVRGMADMVDRVRRFKPDQQPDYYFAFGYNQARAVTALLEKAVELGDLSHAGLLDASRQLGNVSFDGLTGDYAYGAPADRDPPRQSTIFAVDATRPFGLRKVAYLYEAPAAREFPFRKTDL